MVKIESWRSSNDVINGEIDDVVQPSNIEIDDGTSPSSGVISCGGSDVCNSRGHR